jgi:hypothetical protein
MDVFVKRGWNNGKEVGKINARFPGDSVRSSQSAWVMSTPNSTKTLF